jgi:dTDP-4-amino-4,6-dideoxygalactose transaminase
MQFIDLAAQQARIRSEIDCRIKTVLDHGKYIMGPEIQELEETLCAFTGAKHCITCASGTDALLMPLMAWGIGAGDAVFAPPFTFFSTVEEPALAGATPVFVDVRPDTFNMDPNQLEKAIEAVQKQDPSIYPLPKAALEKRLTPRVIIPVDLFGQPAEYDRILAIAKHHGLRVMEDAAQAFGASQNGMKTCALGCDAATTSFFPAKPLGCYGDGGAVFTDDDALEALLRSIRVHGKGEDKYDNVRLGLNGRLDTLQAAILLAKMTLFPGEIESRQTVAAAYRKAFAGSAITTPTILDGNVSAWAQYCILLPEGRREDVMARLKDKGIPSNIYYPKPQHQLAVFKGLGYTAKDMPAALDSSRRILALPFHPYMSADAVRTVADAVLEALS